MPAIRSVVIGDKTANVRELTFSEVRDWLVAVESGESAPAAYTLAFEDCGLADLAHMCDLSLSALEAFAPSELAELKRVAMELNPHFFRVRAALTMVARQLEREAVAMISTAPPVFSSNAGIPASSTTPGAPT